MKKLKLLPEWFLAGLILPLLLINGWALLLLLNYFQPILTKLVTAMLLSFVLSYPVSGLQRLKIPRTRAVFFVTSLSLSLIILLGVTVIPALIAQGDELAKHLPDWIESGRQQVGAVQAWARNRHFPIDVTQFTLQLENRIATQLQALSGEILNVLLGAISSIFDLMLTVVLTFYLLLHGERLWNGIFQWFPPQRGQQIRQAFRQNFQNYFIGQMTLALLMGTSMTFAFVIIQVPFGLLFGFGVGLLALVPFGVPLGIAVVSVLTSLKSIWLGLRVVFFATLIDQLIENGVAPQLIGKLTGLNPVWILVFLLVGLKVGGVLGLVVAVPFASSVKTIIDSIFLPEVKVEAQQ
jgi:predicted PurR-regulated permease PerM